MYAENIGDTFNDVVHAKMNFFLSYLTYQDISDHNPTGPTRLSTNAKIKTLWFLSQSAPHAATKILGKGHLVKS